MTALAAVWTTLDHTAVWAALSGSTIACSIGYGAWLASRKADPR